MHASAHWLACSVLFAGGKVVMDPSGHFDPAETWRLVSDEGVHILVVVGDAMARPLVDELVAHGSDHDLSTLIVVGSGGAILSPSTKERLAELLPGRMIVDGFGSSETGQIRAAAGPESNAVPRLAVDEHTAVVDDAGVPVAAGSGRSGHLARSGHIPLGYLGDPEKTAATFPEIDGVRWVLPGDAAMIEADGTITVLGRGTLSINTGGEKVYPEEVEAALKGHPDVMDAIVVGLPDDRWGERVVALVEPRTDRAPSPGSLEERCREHLAPYKVPRTFLLTDRIERAPSGKADYRWARARVAELTTADAGVAE
jgi:acyl-CoA synthetase (AMP-forming)/AMP-acid ligase II